MAVYMISYDLNAPTNNRDKVMDDIKSIGTWCKYLSTTFLVESELAVGGVEAIATKNLDSNDKMIVCKIEKPIRGWLSQDEWDWIKENL